ncbi:DUF1810 family protein [Kineococcus aurantiacus]|uniref:Uncharacterized protein (DUF1810 family) n=1 Tax=Kineococcus aurantiacus TaxID=37633 RepID=A0A7Y9ASY8_9ACTN|nr:uncharacterized protein (DUF1810 family) [Kineococcus aurantiacus]
MDLDRFVTASDTTHAQALRELGAGRKTSHWMWWEFPQLLLGSSPTSVAYALEGVEEARAYLAHPVLGARYRENCAALLGQGSRDAERVLGGVDAVKLRSSATLFAAAGEDLAARVLEEFFAGDPDPATTRLLGRAG